MYLTKVAGGCTNCQYPWISLSNRDPLSLLGTVPNIGIVQNGREEEIEDHDDRKCVAGNVEWGHERVSSVVDLCPVDTNRQHPKARIHLIS